MVATQSLGVRFILSISREKGVEAREKRAGLHRSLSKWLWSSRNGKGGPGALRVPRRVGSAFG